MTVVDFRDPGRRKSSRKECVSKYDNSQNDYDVHIIETCNRDIIETFIRRKVGKPKKFKIDINRN